MKVKPGQLIIFEDGEAYEVYRNTEALPYPVPGAAYVSNNQKKNRIRM